ncbi:MAG: hypothetical protein ABIN37_03340 [Burkholderiaceae bacterium]
MTCPVGSVGAKTCRWRVSLPKRLATMTGAWPSATTFRGEKPLAVVCRQRRIDYIPLGLQHPLEDLSPDRMGGCFQLVKRSRWRQLREISRGQVKGRQIGCVVQCLIIDFPNDNLNAAHWLLLDSKWCVPAW